MQFDSQEHRFTWFAAMLALVAQSNLLILKYQMLPGACFMAVGLILLNLSYFSQKNVKRAISILLLLMEMGAIIALPRWYIGALALPSISCCYFYRRKTCTLLNTLFAGCGWILEVIITSPKPLGAVSSLLFTALSFAAWEILLFFLLRSALSSEQLRSALSAAAVEALEQRTLREQIAKNQKINENNARLEERERISRDIHNYVGHTLSAATVTLDAASLLVPSDQEKALEKIDTANSRVHEAISSVRSVVRTLDADDDRIALDDYLLSLEKMIDEFRSDTTYKVYHNFSQVKSETRIPIQTASFLSSSLSELLTNGVKHGKADLFVVTFVIDSGHIRLKVQDNGSGWGKISVNEKKLRLANGFGLRKIKEYTENCGGNFEIESEDGFTVSLSVPFEEENT